MTDLSKVDLCPCGATSEFSGCCEPFLTGSRQPATPEQLMRSRYCAYAIGGQGDYLFKTWFPVTAQGVTAEELSERTLDWQGLEVLSSSQAGDSGQVEFIARYKDAEGKPGQLHEKSVFQRVAGHWFYVGGEVSSDAASPVTIGRNQPCPCGSTRKYKYCCGK